VNGYEQEQEWDAFPPGTLPPPQAAPAPSNQQWPQQWQQSGYQPWPGYGPGWWPPPLAWPDGPERPGSATTAAVLGFVTAGLTLLVSMVNLVVVTSGQAEAPTQVLLLGVVPAAGQIAGAVRLLDRKAPELLFGSALGSVAVLLLAVIVGALTIDRSDGLTGILMFVLFALPLPILTAVFAWRPVVRGWVAAGRNG
jgi:hypothetical protein